MIQLIFAQKGRVSERMWVRITEQSNSLKWIGVLQNKPVNIDLKWGARVEFHPYDIVSIRRKQG